MSGGSSLAVEDYAFSSAAAVSKLPGEDVSMLLDRIVELFDENEELRYEYFHQVWHQTRFALIYHGREFFRELYEFTEDLLETVKQHVVDTKQSQAHRVAAIYLLYGLYFKQPLVEKVIHVINVHPARKHINCSLITAAGPCPFDQGGDGRADRVPGRVP